MSTTTVLRARGIKVWTSLKDAENLAAAGEGGKLHWFKFGPGPKRRYFVDTDGWLLIAQGLQSDPNQIYSQNPSQPIIAFPDPASVQAIITAAEVAAIPDLGRVQYSSEDRTTLHAESSNTTILNRLKAYKVLSYNIGEESLWSNTGTRDISIGADNTGNSGRPLSQSIYITGDIGSNNVMWQPWANHETGGLNPQLWVHAPEPVPPVNVNGLVLQAPYAYSYNQNTPSVIPHGQVRWGHNALALALGWFDFQTKPGMDFFIARYVSTTEYIGYRFYDDNGIFKVEVQSFDFTTENYLDANKDDIGDLPDTNNPLELGLTGLRYFMNMGEDSDFGGELLAGRYKSFIGTNEFTGGYYTQGQVTYAKHIEIFSDPSTTNPEVYGYGLFNTGSFVNSNPSKIPANAETAVVLSQPIEIVVSNNARYVTDTNKTDFLVSADENDVYITGVGNISSFAGGDSYGINASSGQTSFAANETKFIGIDKPNVNRQVSRFTMPPFPAFQPCTVTIQFDDYPSITVNLTTNTGIDLDLTSNNIIMWVLESKGLVYLTFDKAVSLATGFSSASAARFNEESIFTRNVPAHTTYYVPDLILE